MNKDSENRIINTLAECFTLTFEQAKDLYTIWPITGSDEEGVKWAAKRYKLRPKVVRAVFYSLNDLYQMIEEYNDLKKWWETGQM